MKIKRDHKAEIEAWLKENSLKKLTPQPTLSHQQTHVSYSSSTTSKWSSKLLPRKGKAGNRAVKKLARKIANAKRKKRIKLRKERKKRITAFKARLLNEKLDNEMIIAMENDK